MAVDFSSLLSKKTDEVKRPPVKPAGTYNATISGYQFGESSKKKTPFCQFQFANVTPGEDIDPAQLETEDGPIDLAKWKPSHEFYLTEQSLFRLSEFLQDVLGEANTSGRSMNEILPETRGQPVVLTVSMKASEDGTGFFNRVEQVSAQK